MLINILKNGPVRWLSRKRSLPCKSGDIIYMHGSLISTPEAHVKVQRTDSLKLFSDLQMYVWHMYPYTFTPCTYTY